MTRDVSVFVKCDTVLDCFFVCKLSQIRTSNFCNVARYKNTDSMVGSLVMGCVVGNLVVFPAVKNFENLLRIDEVIAVSLVYYFFVKQCMFARLRENGYLIMSLNTGRNWSKSRPLGHIIITMVVSADVFITLQFARWQHSAIYSS